MIKNENLKIYEKFFVLLMFPFMCVQIENERKFRNEAQFQGFYHHIRQTNLMKRDNLFSRGYLWIYFKQFSTFIINKF